MIVQFIRIVAAAAVYVAGTLLVLVSVLAIWSSYHLTLRGIGHPIFVFFLMSMCLGVPVFSLATAFASRVLLRRTGLAFHVMSVAALYAIVLLVVAAVFASPPRGGLEGGDIALRLSAVVAGIGIVVNALWLRRNIESPTSR
jgi:hypothetical protein